jgi:preprotein translocase subunit SecE
MEKLHDNSRWGVIVFAVVFVASVFMLLADNAMAR